MAAENQHYVPKFILRQFLSDEKNERVSVFDKHTGKTFVTSIRNMMAERRFNDFTFDDEWLASFEPIACAAEDQALPSYRKVLKDRRLNNSPEQKAALAMMLAFQLLRTKATRDQWQTIEEALVKKVEESGGRMQDVRGWEDWQPMTEDRLKREHLLSIQGSIGDYAQIIAAKDFVLAEPAPGRSFYLGDHPVCLANALDCGPRGNLGLAVQGIEIYMPLASDLMLCAFCPSIIEGLRGTHKRAKEARQAEAVSRVMKGELSTAGMRQLLDSARATERPVEELLSAPTEGRLITSNDDNMDYYNSLQTSYAYRYVVCQKADFALAKTLNSENPALKRGRRIQVGL
ncbi:DUF4238 domain-containing protein [Mesorhizobium sp. M1252]|uniref:DUF4238 domain-containing protein n=1 Tax=Mesorhizobium sp. M1252 TaxID=2957073 RepID=UPI00333DE69D